MNPMRLTMAAAVLALLGGLVWWSNKQEDKKKDQPAPNAPPDIVALKEADMKGIEILKGTDIKTVLARDAAGKWSITAPEALPADQGSITSLTSAITKMTSERLVDENVPASELGNYGLAPAVVTVTFTMNDGKTKKLLIGAENPTGNAVYVKLDGENRLYTSASSIKTTFDKDWKDLRERHIVQFESDKVSRLELERSKNGAAEFGKVGESEWQMLKPKAARGDGFKIEDLARKVHELQMDAQADAKTVASGFAGASPVATAKVTTPAGVVSAEIRKQKDDYYVKVASGTYKLAKDSTIGLEDAFTQSADDLRNKKVFDFGFSDPSKIEIKDGGKAAAYEKTGEKWTSGGKNYDSVSVQALIDKLRDLSATKFVDSGFSSPALELTVVSNGGKKTEKVQIAANGMAKRDGEASIYQLDANALTDLRSAAGGVAPEQAATPDAKGKDAKAKK